MKFITCLTSTTSINNNINGIIKQMVFLIFYKGSDVCQELVLTH